MTLASRFGFLPVVALAGLGACANLPVGEDGLSYAERQSRLNTVGSWEMNGRIAMDTGESAFQGRFQWHQAAESMELSIRSPLGAGILQVAGPPDRLTVRARGETWELSDPEPELSALLGWWLPVRSLRAWLLGFSDPAFPANEVLGPNRALQSLEQRLWELRYESYQLSEGMLVPRRIDLSHDNLQLRVIVDRWQPAS